MSEVVTALKAEFEAYKADVDKRDNDRLAKITDLGDTIASLESKIANLPLPEVEVAEVQAVLEEVKTAHAALNPAEPA
jgi:hypothetical protein